MQNHEGEDRPWCVGCDEDITVKHILLDCVDFSDQRPRFYSSSNLKHLFTQVPGHQILSFLKAIVNHSFRFIIICTILTTLFWHVFHASSFLIHTYSQIITV